MPDIVKEMKATLLLQDVTSMSGSVSTDDALTVLHFSYGCSRRRTQTGNPYGQTMPSYLDFTARILNGKTAKVFMERMQNTETFQYSFLFHSESSSSISLSDCQGIIVASGYIVDLEEYFDTVKVINKVKQDDGTEKDVEVEQEQMTLSVRILLSNLVFAGKDSKNLNLIITKD